MAAPQPLAAYCLTLKIKIMTEKRKKLFQDIVSAMLSGKKRGRWGCLSLHSDEPTTIFLRAYGISFLFYNTPSVRLKFFNLIDEHCNTHLDTDFCEEFWNEVDRIKKIHKPRTGYRQLQLTAARMRARQTEYSPNFF